MGSQPSSEDPDPDSACESSAYIPNIYHADNKQIEAVWSRPNRVPSEYGPALASACLRREWLTHTRILRYYRAIAAEFEQDPWLPKLVADSAYFDDLLLQLIQKGYGLPGPGAARKQHDVLCGSNVFGAMRQLYDAAGHKRPHLAFTLQILLEMERADAISAKLSEVCDRAPRCASARQQALNLLVLHCYQLKHRPAPGGGDLDTRDGALARFYECIEDYIDDHKERAFKSSFMEPARYYFKAVGDKSGLDHVNVHGLNWYLALLHATLGIQTPLLPAYDDNVALGVADFWVGLEDACWQHFSSPANFGADFEGIPQLKREGYVRQRVQHGHLPKKLGTPLAKELGNRAVHEGGEAAIRKALAVYLERFMFFFTRDFFMRKAFETLNSEVKPEHAGWRKACETLFQIYKAERGAGEDSLVEHCYRDDYFTDLDVERVHRFFAWLGVAGHPEVEQGIGGGFPFSEEAVLAAAARGGQGGARASADAGTAPAPAEPPPVIDLSAESPSPAPARHAPARSSERADAAGSGGGGSARLQPWVLDDSGQILAAIAGAAQCPNPEQRASAFESWVITEMIHAEEPAGIRQLAKVVVEDRSFTALLRKAVKQKSDWLRDVAGFVFRLHCMHLEGELETSNDHSALLASAVEVVVEPFERQQPVQLIGHFYGALFTQAVTAWLSALQTHTMASAALLLLARRVGKAIVHCFKCLGHNPHLRFAIKERIHQEYGDLSPQLWGSRDSDVVWGAFFA